MLLVPSVQDSHWRCLMYAEWYEHVRALQDDIDVHPLRWSGSLRRRHVSSASLSTASLLSEPSDPWSGKVVRRLAAAFLDPSSLLSSFHNCTEAKIKFLSMSKSAVHLVMFQDICQA